MRRGHRAAAAVLLAGLLLGGASAPLGGGAAAQGGGGGRRDPNPDASVEIEQVRVGVLAVGGSVGGGRLHFRGEEHAFRVRGMEFGTVGVSTLSARGEVFNLSRIEDFPGRYEEEVAPTPPGGEGGPETRWLRNAAGVEMRLRTERTGGVLRISPGGLTIEFR